MADLAELGLVIRSDGVVVAKNRLRDLGNEASVTEKRAAAMGAAFGRAMALVGAALSLSQIVNYSNTWTDLNSRVEIATGSIGAGAATMQRLSEMARRTYSSLELTAQSYLLNSTALTQLGYHTSQQLDLTEALNNALVVSGAKADRAASVLNAWSKAMAIGKLSGDNLNTVLSVGDRVASALAESMGVSVLELRQLGADGKITTKEMFGLTSQLDKLRAEADGMAATIGDAAGQLSNSTMRTIGLLDEATDSSARIAEAILFVADNMDIVVVTGTGLASMLTAMMIPAILSTALAWGSLTLALLANPLVQIALLVGVLTTALVYLAQEQRNAARAAEMHDMALGANASALETAKTSSQGFRDGLRSQIQLQLKAAEAALEEAGAQYKAAQARAAAADVFAGVMSGAAQLLGMPGENRSAMYRADIMEPALANINAAIGRIEDFKGQLASLTDIETSYPAAPDRPGAPDGKAQKEAEKARKAYADLTRGAHEFISAQNLEAQALGMTAEAAARLRYGQDMLNQAANDNIKLTPKMREEIGGLAQAMAAAEEATRRLTEIYSFGKDVFTGFFGDLKSGITEGRSLWESLGNAAVNALDKIADKFLGMALDGIWDTLFKAGSGGDSGGIMGWIGKLFGFANGGFTGNVPANQVAGVVHGGEYVFSAAATNRIGVANLEAMHSSAKGYAGGGYVSAAPAMAPSANQNQSNDNGPRITINNYGTPQRYDVQSVSRDEIVLIARDEASNAVGQYDEAMPQRVRQIANNKWQDY